MSPRNDVIIVLVVSLLGGGGWSGGVGAVNATCSEPKIAAK
jgi:hypothetical protein